MAPSLAYKREAVALLSNEFRNISKSSLSRTLGACEFSYSKAQQLVTECVAAIEQQEETAASEFDATQAYAMCRLTLLSYTR